MTWHIHPVNDSKEHVLKSTCECKPSIQLVNNEILVIHNSYDGREFKEQLKAMENPEKELEALCKWVKEIKGITEIDLDDLLDYYPEYKKWLEEMSK